ncbi:hypothetical protein ACO1O0_007753 [Amphichorda felina]
MKFTTISALVGLQAMVASAHTCNVKTTHRVPHDASKPAQSWAHYYKDAQEFGTIRLYEVSWPVEPDTIISFPNGPRFLYNVNMDPDVRRCEVRRDQGGGNPRGNKIAETDKGDYTEYNCYVINVDC